MNDFTLPSSLKNVHVHFVGIKGTGMAALVEIFCGRGAVVTGSDVSERFYTDEILEKLGIRPLCFSQDNITLDTAFVVYSSAYSPETNPDLMQAQKMKIPCLLYSKALGLYSSLSYSCGICGVHGKTTTTGLCGTVFKELGLDGQVLAGSIISSFGNSCTYTSPFLEGKDSSKNPPFFIAETCEYQRHFMDFCPKKIILTSVESDHQDYYPSYSDILNAFVDYICKLPSGGDVIYCADDKGAEEAVIISKNKRPDLNCIPYGFNAEGDFRIIPGKLENGVQHFSLGEGLNLGIRVPGLHNVKNAAAAVALSFCILKQAEKNPLDYSEKISSALLKFCGGKRRCEIIGRSKNRFGQSVIFIDDYGHHPTAIKTTLEGLKKFYAGRKIIVDFMSHTYSRTEALLEEFSSCFSAADQVIINKIYPSAREKKSDSSVSGELLAQKTSLHHREVFYCPEFDEAFCKGLSLLQKDSSAMFPEGFVFVTMGAGDNWKVGKMILEKMECLD